MKTKDKIIGLAAVILTAATLAFAQGQTAFQLAREGDRYVGDQSKDRVVQIRSERSAGTLTPDIWYVVYYDPDATLKAVEVKFGAGEKMDVSHPLRLLEPITGADRVLDAARLKVDSDAALRIALAQPLLQNLHLTSSQMWLEHGDLGPQWKIELWASKLNNPDHEADLGAVYISSADGTVLRLDLHPNNAD
jgi:hypothetical protein